MKPPVPVPAVRAPVPATWALVPATWALVPAIWALGLSVSPTDRIEFAPTEGAGVAKTIDSSIELYLEDFSILVMGQEIDPSVAGNPEFEFTFETTLTLEDRYRELGEGRPLVLERHFVEIGGEQFISIEAQGESETLNLTYESELEDKAVVFTWNDDDGDYDVTWAEGHDGDEGLLPGLVEDTDLRGLLPDGPVSPGDSWEIEPARFSLLLSPGGNLRLLPDDWGDLEVPEELLESMTGMEDEFMDMVEESLDGRASATYVGRGEGEGEDFAEIALELDIDTSIDLAELMEEMLARITEIEEEVDVDIQVEFATIGFEWEGDGTLVWDLSAGRFHSFELDGDLAFVLDFAISGDAEGESFEFEAMIEMSGASSFSAAAE